MAKSDPGEPGSTTGQIMTPQCETNRSGGKQPDSPPVHTYKDIPSKSGGSGNASITGPGEGFIKK